MDGSGLPIGLVDRLKEAVGPSGWVTDAGDMARYLREERGRFTGAAALVVRPADTAAVAACARLAAEAGVGLVPQAGNTGLCGGAVPAEHGRDILISLDRMTRIRKVDPVDYSMTVEAGCILKDLQDAAAEADRLLPLSLAAEGSCRIGGNLSTNAGGVQTLRYGNARDLVLGLEVVLPDGEIWDGLSALRKNNTGYDLKHLFIGAEGTLGIITAASLKLFPRPRQWATAFVAVPDPAAALSLLDRLRIMSDDRVSSFELMPRICLDVVLENMSGTQDPLSEAHPYYVLAELTSGREGSGLDSILEEVLAAAFEAGTVLDATLAQSGQQRDALWMLRESIPEAQKHRGGGLKHDISVPVSAVPRFLSEASDLVARICPEGEEIAFGHVGDGNIHFNLMPRSLEAREALLARSEAVAQHVHDLALSHGGSFSAEHGIGRIKREEMRRLKDGIALELMRRIKDTIDPQGIMNPGKVLPDR